MLAIVLNQKKKKKKPIKARQTKKPSPFCILKGIFEQSLDGWKDDKEKFKLELLNDIKTFLFTKWKKPWVPSLLFDEKGNVLSGFRNVNGRVYKNLTNIISLAANSNNSPFFITLKKLASLGGEITDPSKKTSVVSYIPMWKDPENKTPRKPDYVLPKMHKAINIEYVKGIEKPVVKTQVFEKLELNQYVENFIQELKKRKRIPKLIYDQADSCHYKHSLGYGSESIHMVKIDTFKKIEFYYSVLFHEITHSTMNPKRLGREKLDRPTEELVAEIGAMIICEEMGLQYTKDNSLNYLNSWLKQAKNVDESLLKAYSLASDSAEYLLKDIDLESLVPESMQKRAKEVSTPIETPGKKQSAKPRERISKKPEKKTIKKAKSVSKKPEQLTLLGHSDNTVVKLSQWKPSTEIIPLKGQLGQLLGGYERNQFAVVLRGEKGAGKTRMLCQMINLFAQEKLNGLFLSLEVSPESELFGNYISYISKSARKHVAVSSSNTIEELEEYCKKYDFIAIDSWGKLKDVAQEDFMRLIEKYPNVIWLCVFQSTTNGTARGGIMSEYDSSMVIQVVRGGDAQCEKNRYNSCDKTYNVFTKKIIRDEN